MGNEGIDDLEHVVVAAPSRDRFRHWPKLPAFRNFMAWEEFLFALHFRARHFRPSHFDVVVGCSYPWLPWSIRCSGSGSRPKFVFVTQNGDWPVRAGHREYRFFACDGLVCVSPEHELRCRGRFPTVVIGNGVDVDRFRPPAPNGSDPLPTEIEAQLPKPQTGTCAGIVLVCAALTPEKRVDAALKAVANVPGAFLLVVGDGPLHSGMAALAAELLPGRHCFAGSVAGEFMPSVYRRADALLHMNAHEPFGIVYLEAAATALPIVAPDVPTARWILDDAATYFADADRPADVGQAIRSILATPLGEAMGRKARLRAESAWTWDTQADRYAEFLHSVCMGPPGDLTSTTLDSSPASPTASSAKAP